MNYAVIDEATGEVVNMAVWDGVSEWSQGEGLIAVLAPEGIGIGWTYDVAAEVFSPPESVEP